MTQTTREQAGGPAAELTSNPERRLAFLAEVSDTLAVSLDYHRTLNDVAQLVVPRLADWCAVDVVEDGARVGVASAHADPEKAGRTRELAERYAPRADAETGVAAVMRSGEPKLFPTVTDEMLVASASDETELAMLRELGITSAMIVPLVARGVTFGTITFVRAEPGDRYGEAELALGRDLARRAAVAIDRARLHDAALRAADRLTRLQTVTAELAQALTPDDVLGVLLHEGIAAAGARAGVVGLVAESGNEIALGPESGYVATAMSGWRTFPVTARLPLAEVVRTREPVYLSSRKDRDSRYPPLAVIDSESEALVVLPLVGKDAALGGVALSFTGERSFSPEDREVLETLAALCGQALERARLHREAELGAERIARLHAVTAQLSGAPTRDEVANVIATAGAALLGAQAGWVAELSQDGERLEMMANVGYPREAAAAFSVLPMSLTNPTTDCVRDAQPRWYASAKDLIAAYPSLSGSYTLFEAMAVVPLVGEDRAVGLVALNFRERRTFDERDRRLLETLAQQCAQALERARLYDEREERANAAFVLAHVADGVFQLDSSGAVSFWNPAAARITGVPAEQALGRNVDEVFAGWERLAERSAADERDAPVAVPVEVGGRELWLSISGAVYAEGTVYAFRDLTDERRLESLRRDFVSTASHELRTPLTAMYGAARTLLDRELPPETRERLLSMVVNEGERLTRIVDDLLLANRLDVGGVALEIEPTDAGALARELVELAGERAPDTITLRVEADAAAPVLADAGRLRQVLANLLDNAIKYSPDGGEIVVTVTSEATTVRFIVADRGLGIPDGERRHIFEKFYRLDPSLTRGVGGTGLGLYISRELVRQMNGRIWVEPREGGGSVFSVELRAA